jgi:transcriptional regulator with XRE-family HTH domain
MEVIMDTGKKIRNYRLEKKISQLELSTKLLVSRQTISNWENGRTKPDMENLILLSKFFNVPLEEFLSEDISEIDTQHTEFTFTAKLIFGLFILLTTLITSIFLSVRVSKFLLVIPFIILDIIFFSLLIFFLRNTAKHSYLKKVNKLQFFVIIFTASTVSFFSIFVLLHLLN